ncbi:MAG: chemotaxis protein CheW, partial [Nannocystaceae bacterium]|nr:chemotaxis protein CheW [Nannocystaceae bacterium]
QHALEVLEEHEVQLIVTDLVMPVMDGAEFVLRVREKGRHMHTPLVVVSSIAEAETKEGSSDREPTPSSPNPSPAPRLWRSSASPRESQHDPLSRTTLDCSRRDHGKRLRVHAFRRGFSRRRRRRECCRPQHRRRTRCSCPSHQPARRTDHPGCTRGSRNCLVRSRRVRRRQRPQCRIDDGDRQHDRRNTPKRTGRHQRCCVRGCPRLRAPRTLATHRSEYDFAVRNRHRARRDLHLWKRLSTVAPRNINGSTMTSNADLLSTAPQEQETEDTQAGKFLTFRLGNEVYGLEIGVVTEIIRWQDITPVPDVVEYIKGIINLRGKVIPVMDVRCRFAMPTREYDQRTCIIVMNVDSASVGLIVDTVAEVVDIADSQIEPPPSVGQASSRAVIKGVGKTGDEVRILLDPSRLVFDEDIGAVLDASAA